MASVDPLINYQTLYQRISNSADLVKHKMEIGLTIASNPGPYLSKYTPTDNETNMDDEYASMGIQYDYHLIDELYEGKVSG